MKKFILAVALLFATTTTVTAPQTAKADYGWECTWKTYCDYDYFGNWVCWQRQQCCQYVWNPWTGAYAWQCSWY